MRKIHFGVYDVAFFAFFRKKGDEKEGEGGGKKSCTAFYVQFCPYAYLKSDTHLLTNLFLFLSLTFLLLLSCLLRVYFCLRKAVANPLTSTVLSPMLRH